MSLFNDRFDTSILNCISLALKSQLIISMDKASRIAVVGAGISGLALSIALKQEGFKNVQIFEKDVAFESRRQGYGLTILQGKSALRQLGVLEQAKRHNAPSKAHYIFDPQGFLLGFYGTLFWDHKNNNRSLKSPQKGLSMHIPRQSLRKILVNRYEQLEKAQNIHWNSSLSSIQFTKNSVNLLFSNSNSFQADVVFGCDGINSAIRRHSTLNQKPLHYLGVLVVLGLCKSSHGLNRNRVFQTADGQFRLFSMPFLPEDPALGSMWQLSFQLDRQQADYYTTNVEKLKEYLCSRLADWHEPIPQMIASTEIENLMSIPAYDRDPVLPELKDKRIVLLGDALHPMSPFKGQGANQALIDAVETANSLKSFDFPEIRSGLLNSIANRAFKKVIQSRERVTKYHNSEFTSITNFLYPGIDENLINLLKQDHISAKDGERLEALILKTMKKHKYI